MTPSARSTDTSPLAWLDDVAAQRRTAGLRRALRARSAVAVEVDLASNDYLGLARHPQVVESGVDALRTWGAGSTGSRLVTGNTELHEALETALADFIGAESALVFSSGYTANLGAVAALSGPGSLVVSDAAVHASLVDACRLSRARVVVTPHRDPDAVEAALADRGEERAVVVTDSVFSTDGALAPLRRLHEVCRRHRAVLLVDEAHGLGVRGDGGRGLVARGGLAGAPDVVMTTTLSKALGSQGGVGARAEAVARAPHRHRPSVHLRHRPGPGRGRRRRGGTARAGRRAVAAAGGAPHAAPSPAPAGWLRPRSRRWCR